MMVRSFFSSSVDRNPSPTPPHKGEGLKAPHRVAFCSKVAVGADDRLAEAVRQSSPSPLWGGVGEGSFFADPGSLAQTKGSA
ncbi:hypothetical protein GGQ64_005278 [Rhizobium azooxidifex]|uniref:Uncharacterized protein n=1 Tax=Mycoplana azooxidifex TaxID=1636188 RepID=A0A7W6DB45_9HYPH|nr:hypothetical protein [Mycoplana azooxidifex]